MPIHDSGPPRAAAHRSPAQRIAAALCCALGLAAPMMTRADPGGDETPSPSPPIAIGTLHISAVRQPIYGFGASQTFNGDALAGFANRETVYRLLFQDLKIDIFRLRNYYDYAGQKDAFESRTREIARGVRRWGGDSTKRGGKAPVRLMFTSWSPPAYLKSNGLVSGRSDGTDKGKENVTLKRGADGQFAYGTFADWWLASVQKFKSLCGAYPDYIAIQNEPDIAVTYEGCEFLSTEGTGKDGAAFAGYDRALAAVADRLTGALGAQAPKIVGPENFTIRREADGHSHVVGFLDPATANGRTTLARLFGVSFHLYGSGAAAADAEPFHAALDALPTAYRTSGVDKPLFQTEFLEGDSLTAVAGMIHDTLTYGEASAYLVWIGARSVKSPGYALVYFNPDTGLVETRERYYAVKAYSGFVGEGWHRIDADCNDLSVKLSAFVGPGTNSDLVAVLVNPTGQERRVALALDGDAYRNAASTVYRSSEGESGERWRDLGALPSGNVVTLPPRSVATVKFARPRP